jgi:hypothetical protein
VALPAVIVKRLSMAQPTRRLLVRLALAAMAIVVVATLFIKPSSSVTTYLVVDLATVGQGSGAVVGALIDRNDGGRQAVRAGFSAGACRPALRDSCSQ